MVSIRWTFVYSLIISFVILVTGLFLLEVTLELGLALLYALLHEVFPPIKNFIPARPDFPGPWSILNFFIDSFPSMWDIATTVWWGTIEEFVFIFFIVFLILSHIFQATVLGNPFKEVREHLWSILGFISTKSQTSTKMRDYGSVEKPKE